MNDNKHEAAIKRVQAKMNMEVQKALKEDYKKGFMNEKFNKIMELKIKWDLGEISKEAFVKFTKNNVMDCWAFKYMNKKKDLSAIKIQHLWREYNKKENVISEFEYNSDISSESRSSEYDPLEETIYTWNESL